MTRFLVTGGSGFVGQALVAWLRAEGAEVIALGTAQGDVADAATLAPFAGAAIDRVYHLAGRSFVPDSWNDPGGFCRVNGQGTVNVLEFARKQGVPVTHVSAYLYGQVAEQPIAEDTPLRPNNPYALSKCMAEQACAFYANVHGLPVAVVRPFNVYGPGQNARFLVPSVVRQALEGPEIQVLDLNPRRDYVYLADLVGLLEATQSLEKGLAVYNAGSGVSLSVSEVIEAVQAAAGTAKPVRSAKVVRANEIDDTRADISKAGRELGWIPQTAFHQGVAAVVRASALKES